MQKKSRKLLTLFQLSISKTFFCKLFISKIHYLHHSSGRLFKVITTFLNWFTVWWMANTCFLQACQTEIVYKSIYNISIFTKQSCCILWSTQLNYINSKLFRFKVSLWRGSESDLVLHVKEFYLDILLLTFLQPPHPSLQVISLR